MVVRSILKKKTLHNIFPVEGYYGERIGRTGMEAS